MAVYDAEQHKRLMEQYGKGGQSNSELIKVNANKLQKITTPKSTSIDKKVKTLNNSGYSENINNNVSKANDLYNQYNTVGNEAISNSYKKNLDTNQSYSNIVNQFGDWDVNDLDSYTHNKTAWYDLDSNPNSKQTKTKQELEAMNRMLREKYGMTEDTLNTNDAGRLGNDIVWNDFVKYGMDKEQGDVSTILNSNTGEDGKEILTDRNTGKTIDPKFNVARMLARREGMFGQEGLGTVMRKDGTAINDGSADAAMVEKLRLSSESLNSDNMILLDSNNPNLGGLYKSGDKYMVQYQGEDIELSEEDYTNALLDMNGFERVEKKTTNAPINTVATPPLVNDKNPTQLGSVSGKYESNGRADAVSVGTGDNGGVSYGMYQFSSKTGGVNSFMNYLKSVNPSVYNTLSNAGKPGSTSFTNAWKNVAKNDPKGFEKLQQGAIQKQYYEPAVSNLKNSIGLDVSTKSQALQEAIWSTSIQHGVGRVVDIVKKALVRTGGSTDDRALITAIYDERGKNNGSAYFSSSSKNVQQSVSNRFKKEKEDLLNMLI